MITDTYRQKLAVRMRQRGALPAESLYRDKKYDTAFIVSAMSDDEDEYKPGKRTGKYVTRPPAYRSKEVSIHDLYLRVWHHSPFHCR